MASVLRRVSRCQASGPLHRCGSRGFGTTPNAQPGHSPSLLRSLRTPALCLTLGGGGVLAAQWYSANARTVASAQELAQANAATYGSGAALKRLKGRTSWRRLFRVFLTLLPAAFLWPLALLHPPTYWSFVASLLEACGPCFVKLAQWMATRRDLLPDSICEELSRLHEKVAAFWSAGVSVSTVHAKLEEASIHLRALDQVPHASGSIAEVFFGELEDGTAVALKCLRPGVKMLLEEDLAWLLRLGAWADRQERLWQLGLKRAAEEFCEQVQMQTDFEIEAAHLRQFQANFADSAESVRFPTPIFSSPELLVLTREDGDELAKVFRSVKDGKTLDDVVALGSMSPAALVSAAAKARRADQEHDANSRNQLTGRLELHSEEVRQALGVSPEVSSNIAAECMSTYMKMIFHDGFIHGDLHPGNIMLWLRHDHQDGENAPGQPHAPDTVDSLHIVRPLGLPQRFWNFLCGVGRDAKPFELVILDAGLAIPVPPEKVEALRSLSIAILYADYAKASDVIYDQSPDKSRCQSPQQFKDKLADVFRDSRRNVWEEGFVQVSEACLEALRLVHEYNVQLDTTLSWVLFSMLTVEGCARQLWPQVDATYAATRYVINVPSLIRELQGGSSATAREMLTHLVLEACGLDFWYWRNRFYGNVTRETPA